MQVSARSSISAAAASMGLSHHQLITAGATYGYVTFWIISSAFVILYNKWILTVWGFAFPITLTMWHMAFCSVVAAALVRPCAWGPSPSEACHQSVRPRRRREAHGAPGSAPLPLLRAASNPHAPARLAPRCAPAWCRAST